MNSGYIVFCYSNCNFLVPLEQFHIILNPDEIIDKIGAKEDNVDDVYFGNKLISVINLSKYINAESIKISSSSRLLVGEFSGQLVGFWVDNITEIINVESKKNESISLIKENIFLRKVKIEGQDYNVLNLSNIINEKIKFEDPADGI